MFTEKIFSVDIQNIRKEVMATLEKNIDSFVTKFLVPVEKIWQPSDFLPDSSKDNFIEKITEIKELSKEFDDDFWTVMVADTITEEALPTYESWLLDVEGINQKPENGWAKWIRAWTAEENRHGDVLNKYLYFSGRVNMRAVEVTTQYLIQDGFDPGTARDPYKNFVYTSFQELATYFSHNNVARIAKEKGFKALAKMSRLIAGDEMRHHVAYTHFVTEIFKIDPSEMMLAYCDMMKHKILMPAINIKDTMMDKTSLYDRFSIVAQRTGIYTAMDYVDILRKLNTTWEIEKITNLSVEAEKARDYLLRLPDRMSRIIERAVIPDTKFKFNWINPAT